MLTPFLPEISPTEQLFDCDPENVMQVARKWFAEMLDLDGGSRIRRFTRGNRKASKGKVRMAFGLHSAALKPSFLVRNRG
jgi:hypothetical protein